MTTRRILLLLGLVLTLTGFSDPAVFDISADAGGGGGYTFTGSARSHGMSCAVCHQGSRPAPSVLLKSTPASLFETGYAPGTTYQISVTLSEEQLGLTRNGRCAGGKPCNRNAFVIEMLHADGAVAGQLCPLDGFEADGSCATSNANEVSVIGGGAALVGDSLSAPSLCTPDLAEDSCIDLVALYAAGRSEQEVNEIILAQVKGQTHWQFLWRAPPINSEQVQLFLGLVDGDGGSSVDPAFGDYAGDSVTTIQRILPPADGGLNGRKPSDGGSAAGCAIGHEGAPGPGVLSALLLLMLTLWWRQWV
jgi:hypothetical protein